jgi:hypothetical protein
VLLSCWKLIYFRLVKHGTVNVEFMVFFEPIFVKLTFNKFCGHILYRNVIQNERKLHNIKEEKLSFRSQLKYAFHYTDFHNTHKWLVALREELIYQISTKSVKNYSNCRSQWLRGLRNRPAISRFPGMRVRIPPGTWVSFFCECSMWSGRGLCDGLIARPEESYRMWWV